MRILFALLIFSVLFFSCDPMRRIDMRNSTDEEIEITWNIKEDSILVSPFFLSNSKKTTFKLYPESPYNRVSMSCGIGVWTPQAIQELTNDLDSVVIKHKGGEINLNSDEEIKNFLFSRRRGFERDKIRIDIKEGSN
ncbi:MAG: hypothetical protein ACXWV9_01655 [Flavisolibacter sp.]